VGLTFLNEVGFRAVIWDSKIDSPRLILSWGRVALLRREARSTIAGMSSARLPDTEATPSVSVRRQSSTYNLNSLLPADSGWPTDIGRGHQQRGAITGQGVHNGRRGLSAGAEEIHTMCSVSGSSTEIPVPAPRRPDCGHDRGSVQSIRGVEVLPPLLLDGRPRNARAMRCAQRTWRPSNKRDERGPGS